MLSTFRCFVLYFGFIHFSCSGEPLTTLTLDPASLYFLLLTGETNPRIYCTSSERVKGFNIEHFVKSCNLFAELVYLILVNL